MPAGVLQKIKQLYCGIQPFFIVKPLVSQGKSCSCFRIHIKCRTTLAIQKHNTQPTRKTLTKSWF